MNSEMNREHDDRSLGKRQRRQPDVAVEEPERYVALRNNCRVLCRANRQRLPFTHSPG